MAAQLMVEIQQDFLTCSLCLKAYQQPKALPCLHSFCTICLSNHIHSSAIKAASGSVSVIFCPMCREVVDVPKSGVSGFQDNYLLKNLLDMIYSARGVLQPCDVCRDEGKQAGAGHCCIKCEDFLCDDCAMIHKRTRVTRDHLVINVSMMKDVCLKSKHPADKKITVRLLTKIGSFGTELMNPIAVTTNRADDIIVSNNNDKISIFTQSGELKMCVDQGQFYGAVDNMLPNRGIAMSTEGFLVVAMRRDLVGNTAQIGVVETLAARQAGVFSVKTRSGKACIPHGIATTPDNYTVITDVGKHCFYIFDPEMAEIKQVGKRGSKNSQFKSPFFVAINRKREILISDYDNHCIKTFDIRGKYRGQFGSMGRDPGELMHPMGLCTDDDGNVFVCDRDNHRVQMFAPDGSFLTVICQNTCRDGNDVRPQDVAMTTRGHLIVLVRGVEGVNVAEIHVLQVGTRFGEDSSKEVKEATGQIAKLRQSLEFLKTPKKKATTLPPIAGQAGRQAPSAPPPDLLGPSFGGHPYPGAKGRADCPRKNYQAPSNDSNSAVCTIL